MKIIVALDLSDQFARVYIEKLGAENFENTIRTDPVRTNQLLNEFLNTKVNLHSPDISNEYNANKASMHPNNIEGDYNKNSKTIEETDIDNRAQVHAETPDNFKNKIQNKIAIESLKQNEVEHKLNNTSTELTLSDGRIQSKEHRLKEEVEDKNDKTATGNLINN